MKKYSFPSMYRGIQVHKTCWAKSDAAASKLLNISIYNIRNYASKYSPSQKQFEGVMGFMDSGKIIFDNGRKDLMNKELPIQELQAIIDTYQDECYEVLKKQIGI